MLLPLPVLLDFLSFFETGLLLSFFTEIALKALRSFFFVFSWCLFLIILRLFWVFESIFKDVPTMLLKYEAQSSASPKSKVSESVEVSVEVDSVVVGVLGSL